jgi:hypothetical protein
LPAHFETLNGEFLDARDNLEIYEDQQNAKDLLDLDGIYCARTVIECTHGTTNEK